MSSHNSGDSALYYYTVCKQIADGFKCTNHVYDWVWWLSGIAILAFIVGAIVYVRNDLR